jgi:hypothetical protein
MMSSVGVEMSTMWRLSDDFNAARRFAAVRYPTHRPSVIYNGKLVKSNTKFGQESVQWNPLNICGLWIKNISRKLSR